MRMTLLATGLLALLSSAVSANAQTVSGELHCGIQGGFGFVIASDRQVTCTYRRLGLPVEFYTGRTGNLGLDLGPTNARSVTYQVVVADPSRPGALQGDFAGPGVALSAGAGFTANALVSGAGAMLVPIPNADTTATTGFNITAGINQLSLQFAAVEERRGRIRRPDYAPDDLR